MDLDSHGKSYPYFPMIRSQNSVLGLSETWRKILSSLGTDTKAFTADRTLLGSFVETFVYQELRRQASWRDTPTQFVHFRDKDGVETDIVIEQTSGAVAGLEIKAAATATSTDLRGLRKLEMVVGNRFVRGIVRYDGETSIPFGDRYRAVQMSRLWSMP